VSALIEKRVDVVFLIGGDGTHRGADLLYKTAVARGARLSVACVPKTIGEGHSGRVLKGMVEAVRPAHSPHLCAAQITTSVRRLQCAQHPQSHSHAPSHRTLCRHHRPQLWIPDGSGAGGAPHRVRPHGGALCQERCVCHSPSPSPLLPSSRLTAVHALPHAPRTSQASGW